MEQVLYFVALLLAISKTGSSVETTTSPQQQNARDAKDLCQVQLWVFYKVIVDIYIPCTSRIYFHALITTDESMLLMERKTWKLSAI